MNAADFIEECRAKRVPIVVVDAPPIAVDPKATTAELMREEEALYWHIANAEAEWGPHSAEAQMTRAMTRDERIAIHNQLTRRHNAAMYSKSAPKWPDAEPDRRAEWDEVKRRTPIQELAAEVLPPWGGEGVRRGPAVWYSCWNHSDTTPSLAVYDDGHFHCFGCHAHGDAIDLARGALLLSSFQATMAFLSARAGIGSTTIAVKKGDEIVEVTP